MINLKDWKKNEGFTLIELLVVVAIIAILALIVLLALNPVEMGRRSRDARRLSDLATLRTGLDLALADGESLPVNGWTQIDNTSSVTKFPGGSTGPNISKYLSVVPADPYKGATYPQVLTPGGCSSTPPAGTTATSNPVYEFRSDGNVYEFRARLESTENCDAILKDGDTTPDNYYEIGTNPSMSW